VVRGRECLVILVRLLAFRTSPLLPYRTGYDGVSVYRASFYIPGTRSQSRQCLNRIRRAENLKTWARNKNNRLGTSQAELVCNVEIARCREEDNRIRASTLSSSRISPIMTMMDAQSEIGAPRFSTGQHSSGFDLRRERVTGVATWSQLFHLCSHLAVANSMRILQVSASRT
jgi:hypothetical protein